MTVNVNCGSLFLGTFCGFNVERLRKPTNVLSNHSWRPGLKSKVHSNPT